MRTHLLPVIAVSTVVAVTVTAALAGGAASGTDQRTPQTLHLTQRDHDFTYVDAPPKGGDGKPPSGGDELGIGGTITQGGSTSIVCTVTHPGTQAAGLCVGVLELAGGQITFTGAGKLSNNTTTSAITGGTGDYAGATGTLVSRSSDSGGKTRLTVNLS